MKKIIGFCPNLFNISMTSELDDGVRQAACVQLKNNVNEFWPVDDDPTLFSIHEDDKAYIRSRIIESIVNSPNCTRNLLLEVLQTIIRNDYPGRWETLPNEIMTYLLCDNQHYWLAGYLCLLKLMKCYEYKKNSQRSILNQSMQGFLEVMKKHMEFLFNDQSEVSVTVQKHILKVYYTYTHLHLCMEVISKEMFTFWMEILCVVSTRAVPNEINNIDAEERPTLIWWKAKKWALHTLSRFTDRYSNPSSVIKMYKDFSIWFLNSFTEKIIQTLFNICEQYSQGNFIAPRMLTFVIISFEYLIKHSHSWKYLKPHLLTLVKEVLFKMLSHTQEDEELWQSDPVEYCRIFFDILSDPTPAYSAGNLLNEVCLKRKGTLEVVMSFITEVLNSSETTAIHKDAAFHVIGEVAAVLLKRKNFASQMESFIVNYVIPVFQAPEGFRRARACWLIGQLSGAEFSNKSVLSSLVSQTLHAIANDPDLPVKIMAAIALSELLVQQPDDVKATISGSLHPLVLQILTLLRETQVDELNDVLQSIIQVFPAEIVPIALDTTTHLKETIASLLDGDSGDIDDSRQLIVMGVLSTVEIVCKAMEDRVEIVAHLEPIIVGIIEIIFTKRAYDFYEEAYNLASSLTNVTISATMWQVLPILKAIIDAESDEISEMMPLLSNYVTADKPSLVADPARIGTVLEICTAVLSSEDVNETFEPCAAKLLEMILINYRGQVDEYVPRFIELVLTRLSRKKVDQSELRTMCIQVIIAALYYDQEATLGILLGHNWPGTNTLIFDEFLTRLFDDMDCFLGIHDRKVCIIGLGILLALPSQRRPLSLQQLGGRIMPSLIKMMETLINTYISNKDDGDSDDDDEDDDEDDEKALNTDENEEDEEGVSYMEMLNDGGDNDCGAAVVGGALSNVDDGDNGDSDDSDDMPEFTTELEEFETDLDTKELEMSEFMHIYNVISQLNSSDPDWYNLLTSSMTEEHQKTLKHVMDTANTNIKEKESKKNNAAIAQ